MPQQQPSSTEIRIAENAFLDSEVHREIQAQKQGTLESMERFWQSLPAWEVNKLRGVRYGNKGMF